jgi:Domain of unknown function (DUF4397)
MDSPPKNLLLTPNKGVFMPDAAIAPGRRRFLLSGLAVSASMAAGASGCGGGSWDDEARVRAVNATADLPAADLRFSDWVFARGLGYGAQISAYASRGLWSVGASGRFAASRNGQTAALVSAPYTLAGEYATSVVLMGNQSTGLRLVAIDEDMRHLGGTSARLRLLHAWPGSGALDAHLTSTDQSLVGRQPDWVLGAYGDLSAFSAPSQVTRLRITPRGQPGWVLFDGLATGLAAGQVLTLVVAPAQGVVRVTVAVLPQDAPGYVLTNLANA